MTFFTLVGETERGVKKRLTDFDLSFAYPIYAEGSMAIHGSSLDQFIYFGDDVVIPRFMGTTEQVTASAEEVGEYCSTVIFVLDLLSKNVWADKSVSGPSKGSDVHQKK